MSRFWRHFITNGGAGHSHGPDLPEPQPSEQEALDAYSSVVVRVAERWGRLCFLRHGTVPIKEYQWIPDIPVPSDPNGWHPGALDASAD